MNGHRETASSTLPTPRAGRYAAIDIGTVTCRMLVADVDAQGSIHEIDREYAITNLGEGVDATGVLKPEAMERVRSAVSRFLAVRDGLSASAPSSGAAAGAAALSAGAEAVSAVRGGTGSPAISGGEPMAEASGCAPTTTIAVATSAARDASNAADFEALLAQAGLTLSVIPGAREAALSFAGASCDFTGEDLFVVDVGGGSTEVVAGRSGSDPLFAHSFNIGCRRVTEKFIASDPPAEAEIAAARSWVRENMEPFFVKVRESGFSAGRLVAVAGTATSVVSVHEAMKVYDTARVHRAVVSREVLDGVYDELRSLPCAKRAAVVGLDPGRAPVIVAGLIILQTVLDLAGAPSFTVSESDILHGIVLDAAGCLG